MMEMLFSEQLPFYLINNKDSGLFMANSVMCKVCFTLTGKEFVKQHSLHVVNPGLNPLSLGSTTIAR